MQAACPEIYVLNASLTEGGLALLPPSPLTHIHYDALITLVAVATSLQFTPHHSLSHHHLMHSTLLTPPRVTTYCILTSMCLLNSVYYCADDARKHFGSMSESVSESFNSPALASLGAHYLGDYGDTPQAKNSPHSHENNYQEATLGRRVQSVKGRSVHFGGVTSFRGDTPSPTLTPDTTTVGLESLPSPGHHSDSGSKTKNYSKWSIRSTVPFSTQSACSDT